MSLVNFAVSSICLTASLMADGTLLNVSSNARSTISRVISRRPSFKRSLYRRIATRLIMGMRRRKILFSSLQIRNERPNAHYFGSTFSSEIAFRERFNTTASLFASSIRSMVSLIDCGTAPKRWLKIVNTEARTAFRLTSLACRIASRSDNGTRCMCLSFSNFCRSNSNSCSKVSGNCMNQSSASINESTYFCRRPLCLSSFMNSNFQRLRNSGFSMVSSVLKIAKMTRANGSLLVLSSSSRARKSMSLQTWYVKWTPFPRMFVTKMIRTPIRI